MDSQLSKILERRRQEVDQASAAGKRANEQDVDVPVSEKTRAKTSRATRNNKSSRPAKIKNNPFHGPAKPPDHRTSSARTTASADRGMGSQSSSLFKGSAGSARPPSARSGMSCASFEMKSISSNKSPLRDEIISISMTQDENDPSRASVSGVWTFDQFHPQSGSYSLSPSHSRLHSVEIEEIAPSVSQSSSAANEWVSFVGEQAMREKYVAYECENVEQQETSRFYHRVQMLKKDFLQNWETYTSKTCLLMMVWGSFLAVGLVAAVIITLKSKKKSSSTDNAAQQFSQDSYIALTALLYGLWDATLTDTQSGGSSAQLNQIEVSLSNSIGVETWRVMCTSHQAVNVGRSLSAGGDQQGDEKLRASLATTMTFKVILAPRDDPSGLLKNIVKVFEDGTFDKELRGRGIQGIKSVIKDGPKFVGKSSQQIPSSSQNSCGNGVVDPGETCDDGNLKDGDGCSSSCKVELGYFCQQTGEQRSECSAICGDLILAQGEHCEDGNSAAGDGCYNCQVEPHWQCTKLSKLTTSSGLPFGRWGCTAEPSCGLYPSVPNGKTSPSDEPVEIGKNVSILCDPGREPTRVDVGTNYPISTERGDLAFNVTCKLIGGTQRFSDSTVMDTSRCQEQGRCSVSNGMGEVVRTQEECLSIDGGRWVATFWCEGGPRSGRECQNQDMNYCGPSNFCLSKSFQYVCVDGQAGQQARQCPSPNWTGDAVCKSPLVIGTVCLPCKADFYQTLSRLGSNVCVPCPINSGTNGKEGSTSVRDCACLPGYARVENSLGTPAECVKV